MSDVEARGPDRTPRCGSRAARRTGPRGLASGARAATLIGALLGCDAGSGAASPSVGERAGDTADSRTVDLPELPACPGADFASGPGWYPANPWWYLRSTDSDMVGTWTALVDAAAATGCPAEATEAGATTFSGDCSAENVDFSGTWRSESVADTHLHDFVLDGMSTTVTLGGSPEDLAASGTFFWSMSVEGEQIVAVEDRADGFRSIHRGSDGDGNFVFEDVEAVQDTEQFVARGAVTVDWTYGSGRYCPVVELHAAPACPGEPDGYFAVQGAETWLMVANGSSQCDGCVEVYRDGVWQETFCELPALLR